ncbi:MAG: family 20 glycosylhydrolase [Armatimonadetes bacterium]|nr:family 20 glycosylhydrolase [Armatimonadota bacterium]
MQTTTVLPALAAAVAWAAAGSAGGAVPDAPAIIPAPVHSEAGEGVFEFNAATRIVYNVAMKGGRELAEYCQAELSRSTGLPLAVAATKDPRDDENALVLSLAAAGEDQGPEGYSLVVSPRSIRIAASAGAGCFYGFQTLRQLLPDAIYSSGKVAGVAWRVPAITVTDRPRFGWRGFMLDVARRFSDKATVKRLIDALAVHKLNSLHLHLTDNDAWRVVIDKYPELTSPRVTAAGSYKGPDKPFFSKEDVREIVAYAKARYITVVPEIEMPGHARAAVSAYPEFGDGRNTFNPAVEGTYAFLDDCLTEVMELFDTPYVHMGADEVQGRHSWDKVPAVDAMMRERGFQTHQEVEAYFDRRMADLIIAKGGVPCGWDEATEYDLDRRFIAFWWRNWSPGKLEAAVKKGHRIVACPANPMYIASPQERGEHGSHWYGEANTARRVYEWEPVPDAFSESEAKQILGVEACLWTAIMKTDAWLEYKTFPVIAALAEVAWIPKGSRDDYPAFRARVERQVARYERMGFYYRRPVENVQVAQWSVGEGAGGGAPLLVDLTPHIREAQQIGIVFFLEKDATPYDKIQTVELLDNDRVIASSSRIYNYNGEMLKTHIYALDVKEYRPDASYRLRAVPRPGMRFDAVVYLRPFVQPETYLENPPWPCWPARYGSLLNVTADPPQPPGANLLRNSSFEEDLTAPYIDYWFMAERGYATLDDQVAKEGARSVCLKPNRYDRGITYQYLTNLEKGREYAFSVWARAEKPDSLLLVSVAPEWREPNGLGKMFRVGTDWERLVWTFTVPADVQTLRDRNRFTLGLMNPEFYYPEWTTGRLNRARGGSPEDRAEQIVVSPKNGLIWLDAAQLELGSAPTVYKPSRYGSDTK